MDEHKTFQDSKCPICTATLSEGCIHPERCVALEMKMQKRKDEKLSEAAESVSIIDLEKMMMPK